MQFRKNGVLLEAGNNEFESQAVLNPACFWDGDILHIFYRGVRFGNHSAIGYCQMQDNRIIFRSDKPILFPEQDYESYGVEDPRISCVDGRYYLTYTAYDGDSTCICYAEADKLPQDQSVPVFTKKGILSPHPEVVAKNRQNHTRYWNKNGAIFPKLLNGSYYYLHENNNPGISPAINVVKTNSLDKNRIDSEYCQPIIANHPFENASLGAGCPPIETTAGWLIIYNATEGQINNGTVRAGAALLDLEDPTRLVGKLPYPLFEPELDYEKYGDKSNVVFPTGAIIRGTELQIYYGAADKRIAWGSLKLIELLDEISKYSESSK